MATTLPRPIARARQWPLVGVVALAATSFAWQLGSSSLFVDEVLSWHPAMLSLHGVYQNVHDIEISPPGYYLLLHEWIYHIGSQLEWVMRLPSVLAGIALVAVIYWLATLVADRRTAWLASLGAATSSSVLGFAQEARAYIFAMLFVTLGTAALVEARRRDRGRARILWLLVACLAAIGAFWTHYTANLVLVPVLAWFAWRPGVSSQGRVAVPLLCMVVEVPLAPLLSYQLGQGHEAGIAASANLNLDHSLRVLGTPFDGRFDHTTVWTIVGAAIVSFTLIAAFSALRGRRSPLMGEVILPAAVIPLSAVFLATIVAKPVLLSRYTAVAAPFLLILIAFEIAHAARPVGIAIGVGALVAVIGGSALTHSRSGLYADVRGVMAHIQREWQPRDVIFISGYAALPEILDYYLRRGPAAAPIIDPNQAAALLPAVVRARRRIWLFGSSGYAPRFRDVQAALAPLHYRPVELDRYPGVTPLNLVLAVPR